MASPVYLRRPELSVLVAVGLVLASRELIVRRYLTADSATVDDRRSFLVLWTVTAVGTTLALFVPFSSVGRLPAASSVFWLGIVVMLAGFLVRMAAVRELGRLFDHHIVVTPAHEVVDSGPYSWVRHPAYTGAIVTYLGIGLVCGNWVSLLATTASALAAYGYRVRSEEATLRHELDGYESYCRRVPYRLVPFLW